MKHAPDMHALLTQVLTCVQPLRFFFHCSCKLRNSYDFGRTLGKGQFGTTRLVTDKKTGEVLACKSISKRKLVTPEDIADVQREVQIMHHLAGHPNVVTLRGAYEDKHHVHIVMEVCQGGELFDRIVERGKYTEKDAAEAIRTIVKVSYVF
jgi:calcium-dependent protein kinase